MTSSDKVSPTLPKTGQGLFVLTVESFSVLLKSKMEKLESDEFEADGFKWKLILYPNGNSKQNGSGYISLYLSISSLPRGFEVDANFSLFVYNHITGEYSTWPASSTSSKPARRRFHSLKTQWGFSRFVELDTFKRASSGYLIDDTCAFRAEVSVITSVVNKTQCLSTIKVPEKNIFKWDILNFSAKGDEQLFSDKFKIGELQWRLSLYPKGNGVGEGKCVSLYLEVADDELKNIPGDWKVYLEFVLRVKCKYFSNITSEGHASRWFNKSELSWYFLVNDCLVVEAEITTAAINKSFK